MKYIFLFFFGCFISCSKNSDAATTPTKPVEHEFISAADLSSLPLLNEKNIQFYDENNAKTALLPFLKNNGLNTVRIRIWNHPATLHSGFEEVKYFSEQVKSLGLKVWITVHYSDTWADPGQQTPPKNWQNIPYSDLKDSVFVYTKKIMTEIKPDYIQIGNEINSGLLFPEGEISENETQFIELLSQGVKAVRETAAETKIIIHFAGTNGSDWFFNKLTALDYNIIGLSYYPIWHGKDLNNLASTLTNLSTKYKKDIVIAETAYPFTLDWNDWTNNIIGTNEQLILPDFEATETGQQQFISTIKSIVKTTNKGIGFCYWGGELIAFNGPEATNGSPWENQALFNFKNQALSVTSEFDNN